MARSKKMTNAVFKKRIEWALRLAREALGSWHPTDAEDAEETLAEIRAELRRRYRQRRPLVGPQHKFRVAAVEATHRGMLVTFKEVK